MQEVLAKLSWNHNQISLKLYDRQALLENKTENYSKTLPTNISDKAREMLKDPYIFDFLTKKEDMKELEIEK